MRGLRLMAFEVASFKNPLPTVAEVIQVPWCCCFQEQHTFTKISRKLRQSLCVCVCVCVFVRVCVCVCVCVSLLMARAYPPLQFPHSFRTVSAQFPFSFRFAFFYYSQHFVNLMKVKKIKSISFLSRHFTEML